MRMRRLKIHPERPVGFYHCLSRVVDRQFVLGDPEKAKFVELMREYEAFCGVDVLSYCILSNHFHILIAVPKRPSELPSEDELLRRLDSVSGATLTASKARQMFDMFRKAKDEAGALAFRQSIWKRFYDVSEFMKLLKQRYTQWHNRRHQRKGTLWEERFKSVLVEGAGHVLATMAAYIDLNPVRAGIVKDTKDYRWCSYGEAMAGKKRARLGIQKIAEALHGPEESLTRCMEIYRQKLAIDGMENEGTREDGSPMRLGIKVEAAKEILKAKGKLPMSEYLKCRVRYFGDGLVLGSREFVDGIFRENRKRFGDKRQSGARRMRGVEITPDQPELCVIRDLQLSVFG